nr:26S proteasome SU B6 [Cryptomonas sp.]
MWMIESYWKKYLWEKNNIMFNCVKLIKTKNSDFNPYQNNGGTIISIAGENFCIIASDTRYSAGFSILTRFQTRITKISNTILLATSGMFADIRIIQKHLKENITEYQGGKEDLSINSSAFYLSSVLYSRRFFPYYTFNILSGLEKNNKGSVYSFDAVGSFEKLKFSCTGSGQSLIQSILEASYGEKARNFFFSIKSLNDAVALVKEFFIKAGKRGIYIGDGLQIFVVTKKGILVENSTLRVD